MPLRISKPLFKVMSITMLGLLSAINVDVALASNLIIQNATLISPERKAPLQHASVLIENGKITKVSDQPISPTDDTQVLDASNLFLIPGLMDSHLHTLVMPGLGFIGGQRSKIFAGMTALYQQQLERSLLYHGVTQILDPAAHPAALKRSQSRDLAPDIFHCGAAPLANGYPSIFMDKGAIKESLPYRIYQDKSNRSLSEDIDRSQHTPEAVVERMRNDGAICLKLFFEDGWDMANNWPMLNDESLERVISAAHNTNLKVIAHANALDMQQLAVKHGVDVLGHGLWNWNQYGKHSGMPDAIKQHLDTVHAAGIGYQPTLRVMDSMQELFIPEKLDDPALKKVVPPDLLDWYKTEPAQRFKKELAQEDFGNLPDQKIVHLLKGPINRSELSLRYLSEIGHDLLLASDHPATPGHANHPGLSTYQELVHMAALGIPLKKIFESATINNAKTFGLEERYGTIGTGKKANLLLLESNPLQTVEAYNQIRWVVVGGQVIARETLAADQLQ